MTIQCPECGSLMVDKIHKDNDSVTLVCNACEYAYEEAIEKIEDGQAK